MYIKREVNGQLSTTNSQQSTVNGQRSTVNSQQPTTNGFLKKYFIPMESQKDIRDELNELSPLLSKLDKREGFQVPPSYFKKLTHEVLQKAKTESAPAHSVPQWQQSLGNIWASIWQPKMAMGLATIALLVVASTFFFNNGSETDSFADLSSISDAELDFYIQENFDELDMELFADAGDASVEGLIPSSIDDEVLNEFYEQSIDDMEISDLEELL